MMERRRSGENEHGGRRCARRRAPLVYTLPLVRTRSRPTGGRPQIQTVSRNVLTEGTGTDWPFLPRPQGLCSVGKTRSKEPSPPGGHSNLLGAADWPLTAAVLFHLFVFSGRLWCEGKLTLTLTRRHLVCLIRVDVCVHPAAPTGASRAPVRGVAPARSGTSVGRRNHVKTRCFDALVSEEAETANLAAVGSLALD